jgi:lysine 2,3-aminomutase
MSSEGVVSEPPGSTKTAIIPQENKPQTVQSFRERHFPEASEKEWDDWKWQLQHTVRSTSDLRKFGFSEGETDHEADMPMAVTPYYLSLMDPDNGDDPLRKCMVPSTMELVSSAGEESDPLHEDKQSPVEGLVHRYPDRVLVMTTDTCSCYCRYCTRSRLVGGRSSCARPDEDRWRRCADYVKEHPKVRDVILSGGDPLTMSDARLYRLLDLFKSIPNVEVIRIGTKVPMVLPQRVTPALCKVISKFHPVWMSVHVTHPRELTPESSKALAMLADAGIPLGSQTVLLKGVNDNVSIIGELCKGLMHRRVRPYYLYSCDRIVGSKHFRTTLQKGAEIIRGLRGFISGYAVPNFVFDSRFGKIHSGPEHLIEEDNLLILKGYNGSSLVMEKETDLTVQMGRIYIATNTINGKRYVGQTTFKLSKRIAEHSKDSIHNKSPFQKAIHKYGIQNFEFIEFEYPVSELDAQESYWIAKLETLSPHGYNLCRGGKVYRDWAHTDKTKELLSERGKGRVLSTEHKAKIARARLGKHHSVETKEQIRKKKLGVKIGTFTQEHKSHLSESIRKSHKRKTYIYISPNGETFVDSSGFVRFCQQRDLSPRVMYKVLKGEREHHKGWKVSYASQVAA